jgi:hypothetical protein
VLIKSRRHWLYAVVLLLLFQAISVTLTFPNYIGYANEAFGGPKNVWRYVSDSSADWAQQLHAVKRYTDERHIQKCWFVYFGTGVNDYNYYKIPCKLLPTVESIWLGTLSDATPAIDGPVFISAVNLTGFEFGPPPLNPYEQFKTLKAADAIIRAHEGMNNFYNEEAPTLNLEKLGTVIPAPAIGPCITALLCVRLGNSYGTCWAAWPVADKLLKKQATDRWVYYLEKILPGETRILEKLLDAKPQAQWITLAADVFSDDLELKDKTINDLVLASLAKDGNRISTALQKLIAIYYSKGKQQGV